MSQIFRLNSLYTAYGLPLCVLCYVMTDVMIADVMISENLPGILHSKIFMSHLNAHFIKSFSQ